MMATASSCKFGSHEAPDPDGAMLLENESPPDGLLYIMYLILQLIHEWIKHGDFSRVVALFVLSEQIKVRDILRPPAVKIEFILPADQLSQNVVLRISDKTCSCAA